MIERYRQVQISKRADERYRALSRPQPNAQTLWDYLLDCGHDRSIPGLLVIGLAAIAEELGWGLDGTRAAWAEIEALDMARADWAARVVWLPNAVRHRQPRNPSVLKGWARGWSEIPTCALKVAAFEAMSEAMTEHGPAFVAAFVVSYKRPTPLVENINATQARHKRDINAIDVPHKEKEKEKEKESEGEEWCELFQPPPESSSPVCAEVAMTPPSTPPSPTVLVFPVLPGMRSKEREWPLTQERVDELQNAFPALDVLAEARKALAWLRANGDRRKTFRGMPQFLFRWLSRVNDRGWGGADGPRRRSVAEGQLDEVADLVREAEARERKVSGRWLIKTEPVKPYEERA